MNLTIYNLGELKQRKDTQYGTAIWGQGTDPGAIPDTRVIKRAGESATK